MVLLLGVTTVTFSITTVSWLTSFSPLTLGWAVSDIVTYVHRAVANTFSVGRLAITKIWKFYMRNTNNYIVFSSTCYSLTTLDVLFKFFVNVSLDDIPIFLMVFSYSA